MRASSAANVCRRRDLPRRFARERSPALFVFDEDRRSFLDRLATVVEQHELACIAYCLMGNHYHLIVQTPDERLSLAMQRLNGGYSKHFNRIHGRTAHLFRNRFLARQIEDESYLLTAVRYVAHNPVRAGLCVNPIDWPWGSHRATIGLDPMPHLLDITLLRDACGAMPNWRARYQEFVNAPAGR